MTTARQGLGARGELLAAAELQRQGYTIRATNWRCRFADVDLAAREASARRAAAFPAGPLPPKPPRRAVAGSEERWRGG